MNNISEKKTNQWLKAYYFGTPEQRDLQQKMKKILSVSG